MPRHMLPNVGTTVWYFADPTRRPQAAIVAKRVSEVLFNLTRILPETGVATATLNVPFLADPGLKPASGAYCTPTGIQDTIDGATDVSTLSQRATAVASIVAGGANYVVGDVLSVTASGGVTIRVATLTGNAVATATIVNAGNFVKPGPTGTLNTTGGSGTGCTVTLTWTDN